jgi:hypothetical protein
MQKVWSRSAYSVTSRLFKWLYLYVFVSKRVPWAAIHLYSCRFVDLLSILDLLIYIRQDKNKSFHFHFHSFLSTARGSRAEGSSRVVTSSLQNTCDRPRI